MHPGEFSMKRPTSIYAACRTSYVSQSISPMTTKRVQPRLELIVDGVTARGGGGSARS
jgi:hypothetical protein